MSSRGVNAMQAEDVAIRWLAKLNSPGLTQAEQDEFFAWMNASPLNQAAYIKAEELWERGAVLERAREPAARSFWQFQAWQGWAVACSLLLVSGLIFFTTGSQIETYQTLVGEQREILLDDGSRITLNTDSRIDVYYTRQKRTVTLHQGEAFFDVKDNRERPFEVVTEFGLVRVVGTRFSVHQQQADTVVTVVDGRVALMADSTPEAKVEPDVVLQANQRAGIHMAAAGGKPEQLDAKAALAWREKQLIFRGKPLSEVIVDLDRYLPETIALDSSSNGDREITAVIQLADTQMTLKALEAALGLKAEADPSGNVITLSTAPAAPSRPTP